MCLLHFIGGWHSVGEVPASEQCIFKVTDLIHKKEYKFRIRAENKLGSSEPNIFGKPILAKDPWGKFFIMYYHFDLLNMNILSVIYVFFTQD